MSSTRCVVLKCKVVKGLFGTDKTTTWQQRIIELGESSLRWFATDVATTPQNEIPVASITSSAAHPCTDNPWVRRSYRDFDSS